MGNISKSLNLSVILISFIMSTFIGMSYSQEEWYDPAKEPPVDKEKIINDIKDMKISQVIFYLDDLTASKKLKAAVFAAEWVIEKYGEETKKWPVLYSSPCFSYINIKDLDNAFKYCSKWFLYQEYNGNVPTKADELRLYQMKELLFFVEALINDSEDKIGFEFGVKYARNFKEMYPDAPSEMQKKVDSIIKAYEEMKRKEAEFKIEQQKIMQLGQEFLNQIAVYINEKNEDGLNNFFNKNTTSKRYADGYTKAMKRHFFPFDHINFVVSTAIPFGEDINCWQIFYSWNTEPDDLAPVEERESSMTVIIENNVLKLIE